MKLGNPSVKISSKCSVGGRAILSLRSLPDWVTPGGLGRSSMNRKVGKHQRCRPSFQRLKSRSGWRRYGFPIECLAELLDAAGERVRNSRPGVAAIGFNPISRIAVSSCGSVLGIAGPNFPTNQRATLERRSRRGRIDSFSRSSGITARSIRI